MDSTENGRSQTPRWLARVVTPGLPNSRCLIGAMYVRKGEKRTRRLCLTEVASLVVGGSFTLQRLVECRIHIQPCIQGPVNRECASENNPIPNPSCLCIVHMCCWRCHRRSLHKGVSTSMEHAEIPQAESLQGM